MLTPLSCTIDRPNGAAAGGPNTCIQLLDCNFAQSELTRLLLPLLTVMQGLEEEQCELVVLGAGLAGLHVVSRLPEKLLEVMPAFEHGRWSFNGAARCRCLALPHNLS